MRETVPAGVDEAEHMDEVVYRVRRAFSEVCIFFYNVFSFFDDGSRAKMPTDKHMQTRFTSPHEPPAHTNTLTSSWFVQEDSVIWLKFQRCLI